jgi:hypothetical protein
VEYKSVFVSHYKPVEMITVEVSYLNRLEVSKFFRNVANRFIPRDTPQIIRSRIKKTGIEIQFDDGVSILVRWDAYIVFHETVQPMVFAPWANYDKWHTIVKPFEDSEVS